MTAQVASQTAPGAGDATELDLQNPGILHAKPKWESMTTFHLVVPQPGYTRDQLMKNPQVNPRDDLMRPWSINFQDVKGGIAECDLGASGRAGEIMLKLTERYDRGEPRVEKVKAIFIAKARDGNRIPDAQVVEVREYKLKTIPTLTLKPGENTHPQTYVTVQNFKNGVKEFKLELTTTGMDQVELTASPGQQITANPGGSAAGRLVLPVVEGRKYAISVAVPFSSRTEDTYVNHPYAWYGGWYQPQWTEHRQREIWTGGDVTLTAKGVGVSGGGDGPGQGLSQTAKGGAISKTVKLRAESWASAWLSRTPPVPMRHAHC